MAKLRGVDAKLNRLRLLRDEPAGPTLVAELRAGLGDSSNLVAAEAAQIVGARGLAELTPELLAAFERGMVEPETTDKLCRAKIAIVEALNRLEYEQPDVFLRGIRHVQMEAVWGGQEDSAAPLRGGSAFGLVRIRHRDVLVLLADLLADAANVARIAAVQALGQSGWPAAIPLLRYKARIGDHDSAVTAECLTALVGMAPEESLPLITEFLHATDEAIQQGAAFALAESRRPDALAILTDFWPAARSEALQESILLAIAMIRLPAGLDFLLELVAQAKPRAARAALNALAIHRHNDPLRNRIAAAVTQRGDAPLQARFKDKFESNTAAPGRRDNTIASENSM